MGALSLTATAETGHYEDNALQMEDMKREMIDVSKVEVLPLPHLRNRSNHQELLRQSRHLPTLASRNNLWSQSLQPLGKILYLTPPRYWPEYRC